MVGRLLHGLFDEYSIAKPANYSGFYYQQRSTDKKLNGITIYSGEKLLKLI